MDNAALICSASRGLLGRVTSNLRGVYITFENEIVVLTFYYDKDPSEDEWELANLVDTEFIGDFSSDFQSEFRVTTLPYPKVIPKEGLGIYRRYED